MPELVIPSGIPWDKIKGKDLEELIYWLLDEMGAKDLVWRIGGSGNGATDQGRDLEAFFYMSSPDGEIIRQKWWIQAKGRSKTVEAKAVKETILTASGISDVDVILIVTNTQFSNPTRDWVKERAKSNPRPVVKLWDKNDLEKLVCRHPSIISRLYLDALSLQGKLELIRSQFWNHAHYPGTSILMELWKHKTELKWDSMSMIAVIAGEASNGDFGHRPWPMILSNEELIEVLILSITNVLPFIHRALRAGINTEPYIKGVSYIILVALDRLNAKVTSKIIENCWNYVDYSDFPKGVKKFIINPILRQLRDELFDICASDCQRVYIDPVTLDKKTIKNYWLRLTLSEEQNKNNRDSEKILIIESFNSPCKIGFKLDKKQHCPIRKSELDKLDNDEEKEINIFNILRIFEKIVKNRKHKK